MVSNSDPVSFNWFRLSLQPSTLNVSHSWIHQPVTHGIRLHSKHLESDTVSVYIMNTLLSGVGSDDESMLRRGGIDGGGAVVAHQLQVLELDHVTVENCTALTGPTISHTNGYRLVLRSCRLTNNFGDAHGLRVSNVDSVIIDTHTIIDCNNNEIAIAFDYVGYYSNDTNKYLRCPIGSPWKFLTSMYASSHGACTPCGFGTVDVAVLADQLQSHDNNTDALSRRSFIPECRPCDRQLKCEGNNSIIVPTNWQALVKPIGNTLDIVTIIAPAGYGCMQHAGNHACCLRSDPETSICYVCWNRL
jgi:hypothetical protein